jgi:DNA-binding MarR family transcriptional regulator
VSGADLVELSGLSRGEFAAMFTDAEGCLLAAFDLGVERAAARTVEPYRGESRWLDGVKAGLAGFLRFLEEEPALARFTVVYAMGGGERLLRRRQEVFDLLAGVVDRGREETHEGRPQPPPVVAEGVVGAVLAVVQRRLIAAEEEHPLSELFGPLASIVVLPYLGPTVARRELNRPPPRLRSHHGRRGHGARPLRRPYSSPRLTYRTVRVLSAIEDYPGASNREVAERAGIVDQGQISKLLSRLEERRLIEKIREARTRGAPNSWRLAEAGEQLMQSAGARAIMKNGDARHR